MYADVVKRIESRIPATQVEEYTGDDGLKHCKRCAGPTQCRVKLFGVEQVVRCLCPCEKQRLAEIEAKEMQLQQMVTQSRLILYRALLNHLRQQCRHRILMNIHSLDLT